MSRIDRKRAAALGMLVATGAFLVVVAWLHVVRPDVDPFRRGVSRYAAGSYGYAVSVAFAMLAAALLIAAAHLDSGGEADASSSHRRALWLGAAGLLVVVWFPLRSALPASGEYWAHQLGGATFFAASTVGVQAVSSTLRRKASPEWLEMVARWSEGIAIVALLLFFASVLLNVPVLKAVLGILQRSCFIALCTSLIALGLGLLTERRPTNVGLQPAALDTIVNRRG
ncbi:MAG TPA: DUF998 domain-containing protein [Vicinamibacterales bacterium]|nr:DUF998 domain-containing protein [Vicinamibacterales bacterium]